jgi:hypothetical protein
MNETQHGDGNVGAGARGFVSSVVSNTKVHNAITVLCAVGAWAGWSFTPGLWQSYFAALKDEPNKFPLLAVTVTALAVAAAVIPIWLLLHKNWLEKKVADQRTDEKAELIALIRSYLSPCIDMLPEVARPNGEGKEALAQVRQTLLSTVQQICGPSGSTVRAVWFEAKGQTMSPRDWIGGECNSTRKFTNHSKDTAGQTAWATAKTALPKRYPDLSKEAPTGFVRGANSKYRTFITCGVLGANDEVIGMLNVDAPDANGLTEIDAMIVGVCAKLLSAAYCLSDTPATL